MYSTHPGLVLYPEALEQIVLCCLLCFWQSGFAAVVTGGDSWGEDADDRWQHHHSIHRFGMPRRKGGPGFGLQSGLRGAGIVQNK